jgi:hypothetical protein
MRRVLLYVVVPLLLALASLGNLFALQLETMMQPSWSPTLRLAWNGSAVLVVVLAILAALTMRVARPLVRRLAFFLLLILIIAAGFIPRAVRMHEQMAAAAEQQASAADAEMQFQSDLLDKTDEVQDHIDQKTPLPPADALAFLEFASGADLSWKSLPDHTPEAFALVEQAIDGGAVDPNALVPGPAADVPPVTLTVAFYDKFIRPGSPRAIRKHDWDVLQILVAKGADLSSPAAAQLRADLARTVVLGEGRFISLQ